MVERSCAHGCGAIRGLGEPQRDALAHRGLPLRHAAAATVPGLGLLAGCAPTLADEVAGRLGNPLSEVPEFRRAAPEAAVDCGADEFVLPPPPPLGDVEAELRGTGLLRDSGVRL